MRLKGKAFEVEINVPDMASLMQAIGHRFEAREGFALATINLDHVTKLEVDPAFRSAYAAHDFVVADGNPIVWISRLAGQGVELMPGSELVVPLTRLAAEKQVPIALVGADDASLQAASELLKAKAPGLEIAYAHAPEYGFEPEGESARTILAELAQSGAALTFLALGAPKQERFAALGRALAPQVGFASVGAGIDFLSGAQVRAPRWARRIAMEWLWRLLGNPRRLFKRYALSALAIPGLAWRSTR